MHHCTRLGLLVVQEIALIARHRPSLFKVAPAIVRVWTNAWAEFVPFLAFPPQIRKVIYTTNTIESLNSRLRKATRNRGHFPTEDSVLKTLYLTIRAMTRPGGEIGAAGKDGWKTTLNTFSVYFGDRVTIN